MSYCVKCIVKGQVQGVFFRSSTQNKARQLHLKGHAFNLISGEVEVVACGKQENVRVLQDWLWNGPDGAVVDDVSCEEVVCDVEGGFVTG